MMIVCNPYHIIEKLYFYLKFYLTSSIDVPGKLNCQAIRMQILFSVLFKRLDCVTIFIFFLSCFPFMKRDGIFLTALWLLEKYFFLSLSCFQFFFVYYKGGTKRSLIPQVKYPGIKTAEIRSVMLQELTPISIQCIHSPISTIQGRNKLPCFIQFFDDLIMHGHLVITLFHNSQFFMSLNLAF